MSPAPHIPTLREAQRRLLVWGQRLPKYGADGKGGEETRAAIVAFQHSAWPPLKATGQFDAATLARLFSDPPGKVTIVEESVAIGAIGWILSRLGRKVGLQMNFSKISKAIAGGIAGAVATTGTMAAIYVQLPPEAATHFPSFVYSVLPWINEAVGFAIGFCVVWLAPPNKE